MSQTEQHKRARQRDVLYPARGDTFPGQVFLGTTAMLLGAGVLSLAIAHGTTGLPFGMPRFWYVNQGLWYFVGVFLFVVGCLVLWKRSGQSHAWKPSRSGIRFGRVVLYTRRDCHLCEQAKLSLLRHADFLPVIEEVDIDTDPDLRQRFDNCVPVVEVDGKVRFRGRVSDGLLRRLIEGTPPIA